MYWLCLISSVAGIKWGGLLQVHFTVDVECDIFNKVFNGCKRTCSTADAQEPGELPQPRDTVTVTLDRDDLVRVFGAVSMLQYNTTCILTLLLPAILQLPACFILMYYHCLHRIIICQDSTTQYGYIHGQLTTALLPPILCKIFPVNYMSCLCRPKQAENSDTLGKAPLKR